MANHLPSMFFGVADSRGFIDGMQQAVSSLNLKDGIYFGDNLFTIERNLSFLDDQALMAAYGKHAETQVEKAILWRTSILLWGVRQGLRLEGDFVECGCYKGTTVRIISDAVNFATHADRRYYLYDLFEHEAGMAHHAMPEHSKELYAQTQERFADVPNVVVTQGRIPEVLADVAPQKIAFMHIDMNNAQAETAALDVLFDRMVSGAVLVLDDYGWLAYKNQKQAEDAWFAERGYQVLELPTGQGLVIK